MTRNRDLKALVRARAAKTGERYTTARRHLLAARARRVARSSASRSTPTTPDSHATRDAAAPTASAKGAVSDAMTRDRTGHGLSHWFAILDDFGAVQKGHTAAARHLRETHHVNSWYSQGITVAYERARGLREPNQRAAGAYEFSASKVIACDVPTVVAALAETRPRRQWMAAIDVELASALISGIERATGAKPLALDARGRAHVRYRWAGSRVDIYIEPKRAVKTSGAKATVLVTQQNLPSRDVMETRRTQWRKLLEALAAHVIR